MIFPQGPRMCVLRPIQVHHADEGRGGNSPFCIRSRTFKGRGDEEDKDSMSIFLHLLGSSYGVVPLTLRVQVALLLFIHKPPISRPVYVLITCNLNSEFDRLLGLDRLFHPLPSADCRQLMDDVNVMSASTVSLLIAFN